MDYISLLKDYNIPISFDATGWVNITCPLCGDTKFKGGINIIQGYYNCWRCGSNPLYEILQTILGVTWQELQDIQRRYDFGHNNALSLVGLKPTAHASSLTLDDFDKELTVDEHNYLVDRGFNPFKLQEKYGLCSGAGTEYDNRLIIPMYFKGNLVSYSSRAVVDWLKPKYRHLSTEKSVIAPKDLLFNIDNCKGSIVAVLEGQFDVMRMGDNCLCSLGIIMSQTQIQLLANRFSKVIFLFDSEVQAQLRARQHATQLVSLGLQVEVVDAFDDFGANDAAELTPAQARQVKKELGLA